MIGKRNAFRLAELANPWKSLMMLTTEYQQMYPKASQSDIHNLLDGLVFRPSFSHSSDACD